MIDDLAADRYLQRIRYRGSREPNAATLGRLHAAHLLAVPFENLSIHTGRPIVLADDALFQKVVIRRQGGFCYELNGLFAALLRALGFRVTMVSAGVRGPEADFGPDFDHMALIVHLEERWLADVGFGDSFIEPLRLDVREPQKQGPGVFQIVDAGDGWLTLMRAAGGEPAVAQYRFTETPREYEDYAAMCLFHQTSPESHFTRRRLVTRATTDGRVTLSDMRLIQTRGVEKTERLLADRDEYARALREHFGLDAQHL